MKRLVLLRREREREKNYNSYTLVSLDVARILHISNPEKIENRIERWSFLTTTWQTIVPSLLLFSWTSARVIPSPRKKIKSSVRSGTINADFPFQFSETRERVGGGVRPPPSPPHPCTFRVQGEREGKVVGVSIRERRRRRVLAHGTVIELGKEVLAKRSDDTPRCSRFSVHESGGNLRVMLFIRVPPVALYSRWRERTKRVARDKMRLAPRRERRISSSSSLSSPYPFPSRDEERTRQKRRRPTTATGFSLTWRMKVAFRALTRAPIVRHGYSISTGGKERDTCPIPTSSETHRECRAFERDFVVSFSHTARAT